MNDQHEIPAGAIVIAIMIGCVTWIVVLLAAGLVAHASWMLLELGWQAAS